MCFLVGSGGGEVLILSLLHATEEENLDNFDCEKMKTLLAQFIKILSILVSNASQTTKKRALSILESLILITCHHPKE